MTAVAGHGDDVALRLQTSHDLAFLRRQHLGDHLIDAQSPGHRLGGGAVVARQHEDAQTVRVQQADRFGRRSADGIGHAQQPRQTAIDGDEQHRLPFAPQFFGPHRHGLDGHAALGQEACVAQHNRTSLDAARHALTRERLEILTAGQFHAALDRAANHGRRQRMLAAALQARGQSQQFGFAETGRRLDDDESRLALRQRAGLVHDQRVGPVQHLQRLGVADEHARLGAAAGADHDRHRRRQAQRTGTGDDQHGHRPQDSVRQRLAPVRIVTPPQERTSAR